MLHLKIEFREDWSLYGNLEVQTIISKTINVSWKIFLLNIFVDNFKKIYLIFLRIELLGIFRLLMTYNKTENNCKIYYICCGYPFWSMIHGKARCLVRRTSRCFFSCCLLLDHNKQKLTCKLIDIRNKILFLKLLVHSFSSNELFLHYLRINALG